MKVDKDFFTGWWSDNYSAVQASLYSKWWDKSDAIAASGQISHCHYYYSQSSQMKIWVLINKGGKE